MEPPQIIQPEGSQLQGDGPQEAKDYPSTISGKPLRSWKYGFLYLLYLVPWFGTTIAFSKALSWTQSVNDKTPVSQRGEGIGWVWLGLGPGFIALFIISFAIALIGIILFSRFVAKRKGWRWGAVVLILSCGVFLFG